MGPAFLPVFTLVVENDPPPTPAPSGQSWSLREGWNMVSLPIAGADPSLSDVSQRCAGMLLSVAGIWPAMSMMPPAP